MKSEINLYNIEKLIIQDEIDIAINYLKQFKNIHSKIDNTQYYFLLGLVKFLKPDNFKIDDVIITLKKGKSRKDKSKYTNKIFYLLGDAYKEKLRLSLFKNANRIKNVISEYFDRVNIKILNDSDLYEFIRSRREFMELSGEESKLILEFLIEQLDKIKDNKYKLLADISDIFHWELKDYSLALKYNLMAIECIDENDPRKKGDILYSIALIYKEMDESKKSEEYLAKANLMFDNKNDEDSLEYIEMIHNTFAQILEDRDQIEDSIKYYNKAYEFSEKAKTDSGKYLYIIADRYEGLNKKEIALKYAEKALNKIKDDVYKILNLKLLARIHSDLEHYYKSINYYFQIIKNYSDYEEKHSIYYNIGKENYKLDNYNNAIKYFEIALKNISAENDDIKETTVNYTSWIARCELKLQNFDKGIEICDDLINKYKDNISRLYPLWILADCYKGKGLNVKALEITDIIFKLYETNPNIVSIDRIRYENALDIRKELLTELGIGDK